MKSTMNKLVRHVRTVFSAMRGSPHGLIAALCGCLMLAPLVTAQVRNPIDTIAGSGRTAAFGDGGPAMSATLAWPRGVAVDSLGNVYVADSDNYRVRRIDAVSGTISTIAGTGEYGRPGDDGPATSAQLYAPLGVAVDSLDNVYVTGPWRQVNRIDAVSGTISTVAGTGERGYSGDGGPATAARFNSPYAVAVDSLDNLYVADYGDHRVRRIDAASGTISTVAGTGERGFSGDGGPATSAQLNQPYALALDSLGNVYVADYGNFRVRRIDAVSGAISTVAGSGESGFSGDGGPATSAKFGRLRAVVVDSLGNLYIADGSNHRVRRVDVDTGIVTTVAGSTSYSSFRGDGGPAAFAELSWLYGLAIDDLGNLYISDSMNHRIRRVKLTQLVTTQVRNPIDTFAGSGRTAAFGDGGPALSASLESPRGVAADSLGNLYIADSRNHRVRRIDAVSGTISTVAGTGERGFSGDDGPATSAQLDDPWGVAVDSLGNVYVSDPNQSLVRRIDAASGTITTVAGTGEPGFSGDGGPATSAKLWAPLGLAVDSQDNLYIAAFGANRVRRVDLASGIITTVAGNGERGYSGNGGPATSAKLNRPYAVAVDGLDNVYIGEAGNNRVRRIDAAYGTITKVAGGGWGFSGDGGAATSARFRRPLALAVDSLGNLYIGDTYNHRVRRVDAASGTITTIAGSTSYNSFKGDGGPAAFAELSSVFGLAIDDLGNLYISDTINDRIRRVKLTH